MNTQKGSVTFANVVRESRQSTRNTDYVTLWFRFCFRRFSDPFVVCFRERSMSRPTNAVYCQAKPTQSNNEYVGTAAWRVYCTSRNEEARGSLASYLVRVNSGRQRHLNHDAVNVISLVQGVHLGQHLWRQRRESFKTNRGIQWQSKVFVENQLKLIPPNLVSPSFSTWDVSDLSGPYHRRTLFFLLCPGFPDNTTFYSLANSLPS